METLARLALITLAGICLVYGVVATAQKKGPIDASSAATGKSGDYLHSRRLVGTVAMKGGQIIFVSRVNKRTWTILNPETLKGFEGQEVRIVGQVSRDTHSIRVLEVMAPRIAGASR